MNKLTQIKNDYEKCKATPGTYTTIPMDWYGYLISLLEEKDKALAFYAEIDIYNKTPFSVLMKDNGDIARKALNTSSNNEGEI